MKLILFLLALLLLVPFANAQTFQGYYENFDGDNPTPIPTPTTWYTTSYSGSTGFQDNGARIENVIGTTVGLINPSAGALFSSNNWTIELDIGYEGFQTSGSSINCDIGVGARFLTGSLVNVGSIFVETGPSPNGPCTFTRIGTTFCSITDAQVNNTVDEYENVLSSHFVLSFDTVADILTVQGDRGSCTVTQASLPNIPNIRRIECCSIISSGTNSTVDKFWMDSLVVNFNDGANFTIEQEPVGNVGSELDTGIKDFAAGVGFKTPESQMLFAIVLIGVSEIIMAFLVGFFNPGKWQNWSIHVVAVMIGIVFVLLGYMEFWILLIAIVLGTTIVNGAKESLNTFKSLLGRGNNGQRRDVTGETVTPENDRQHLPRPKLEGDAGDDSQESSEPLETEQEEQQDEVEESEPEQTEAQDEDKE